MANITLVTKLAQLEELCNKARNAQYIAVDTETTSLKRYATAVGVSISLSKDDGYYIPIKVWKNGELVCPWSDSAYKTLLDALQGLLLQSKRLITHNGVFDAKIIKNTFNLDILDYIYSDTLLLHHTCIDEGDSHALKYLATKYISPEAANPQQDLKDSIIANGGKWTKEDKEFFKADWKILGTYAAWDTIYTYSLFELWQPEIEKQGLQELWYKEVMPLMKVTYELNTTGLKVDLPYFENLKTEMINRIEALEDEVYASVKDQVRVYEINKLKEELNITKRSEIGKLLISKGYDVEKPLDDAAMQIVYSWFTSKNNIRTVFNLNSGDDKAFLIYDVLGIPCTEFTASGKRSTAKSLIDKLAEENADKAEVLRFIRDRSKEIKLLNTYVLPILEKHENGRIYPSFNQAGTTSGRYSCGGNSLNLQTLPRDDERVKAGFIPDDGYCFVAADYSSLEPRAFSEVSGEPKIQKIFKEGLDFYSSIAIDVLGLTGVSAKPDDPNYLGTVDKAKRQFVKAIALSIPYGAQGGRLSQIMNISYEEADVIYKKYLDAYPVLNKWMERCNFDMKTKGYVTSRMGRKKRGPIVHELYNKYKIRDFSKKGLAKVFNRLPKYENVNNVDQLYLECRNSLNVAKNHCIQSMAASIMNHAMMNLVDSLKQNKLDAKLAINVHDEIVLLVKEEDTQKAAELLQYHMEHNTITDSMSIPMIAEPIITNINLAKAK